MDFRIYMIQRYYFKDSVPPILIPYLTKDEPIKAFQSSHTSGAFTSILHPVKIVTDILYNFKKIVTDILYNLLDLKISNSS